MDSRFALEYRPVVGIARLASSQLMSRADRALLRGATPTWLAINHHIYLQPTLRHRKRVHLTWLIIYASNQAPRRFHLNDLHLHAFAGYLRYSVRMVFPE